MCNYMFTHMQAALGGAGSSIGTDPDSLAKDMTQAYQAACLAEKVRAMHTNWHVSCHPT